MYHNSHKCLGGGCHQGITRRFAICSKCEKKYGNSPVKPNEDGLVWPVWLRFMWNDLQRERRREVKASKLEITMTDLENNG